MAVPEGYEDNDVPVRAPFDVGTTDNVSTEDEDDFSTLLELKKSINESVKMLHSVNAFDLKESEGLTIKEQMAAFQYAEQIVSPLQTLINDTVDSIKLKQKEGN